MTTVHPRVCPVELADSLDNKLRRWLQNPHKILAPYLSEGMCALDVGCGPGFFSIELARLVGPGGRVIAADLQQGMLDKLAAKIRGTDLATRIHLLKCDTSNLNLSEPVDFILTFYMVHEVPDQAAFFRQLYPWLRETGKILLVEPRMYHVSRKQFRETLHRAEAAGFVSTLGPSLLLSWSAVLIKKAAAAS
ncbi:MAG TPA: class I SAM-dependent methyltransferase [bacterium]|nr:class I SAM-dependent methyltransferase [bacterium]HQG47400.1 class I SAM-dependent methyltransferase [bacterium]HQI48886.1 class I SAM-dependent methyltransferase [bacterium]HQJ66141.1 class I SAM-dependent methyltransferase [bacterium]